MNIHVFASGEQPAEACAGLIGGLMRIKPRAVPGLATGGTPLGVYRLLIEDYRNGPVSFRQATTFNLDECVDLPEVHPESYHAYMRRNLFDHIDLPPERAHIPNGNASDRTAECRRYDELIEEAGGIDLPLLGIGHNGHIEARTIVLIAKGKDEADIVRQTLEGPITTDCPASLPQTHPQHVVMLDREAASQLSPATLNAAASGGRKVWDA